MPFLYKISRYFDDLFENITYKQLHKFIYFFAFLTVALFITFYIKIFPDYRVYLLILPLLIFLKITLVAIDTMRRTESLRIFDENLAKDTEGTLRNEIERLQKIISRPKPQTDPVYRNIPNTHAIIVIWLGDSPMPPYDDFTYLSCVPVSTADKEYAQKVSREFVINLIKENRIRIIKTYPVSFRIIKDLSGDISGDADRYSVSLSDEVVDTLTNEKSKQQENKTLPDPKDKQADQKNITDEKPKRKSYFDEDLFK